MATTLLLLLVLASVFKLQYITSTYCQCIVLHECALINKLYRELGYYYNQCPIISTATNIFQPTYQSSAQLLRRGASIIMLALLLIIMNTLVCTQHYAQILEHNAPKSCSAIIIKVCLKLSRRHAAIFKFNALHLVRLSLTKAGSTLCKKKKGMCLLLHTTHNMYQYSQSGTLYVGPKH